MAITRRQFITRTGLATAGHAARPEPVRRTRSCARRWPTRSATATWWCSSSTAATTGSTPSCRTRAARCAPPTTATGTEHQSVAGRRSAAPPSATTRRRARSSRSIPGFAGLKALYDLGKVAVVQGCGYPDYSLSHEESRSIWQTANPLGYSARTRAPAGSGGTWRAQYTRQPGARRLHLRRASRRSSGRPAPACSRINRLSDFGFPVRRLRTRHATTPQARRRSRRSTPRRPASRSPSAATSATPASRRCSAARAIPQAHDVWETERPAAIKDAYDDVDRSTARDLREIAKIIYAQERRAAPAERQRALLPPEQRRLRHPLRSGRRRARRPALRPAQGGRRLAQGLLRRPRRHGRREPRVHRRVERVLAPHPAERQRHRPRLAGTDVRRSAARSSAASTASIPTSSTSTTTRTRVYKQGRRDDAPLDRLPRRVRHGAQALRQHDAGGHPGERAAARRRRSRRLLDGRRTSTWASCRSTGTFSDPRLVLVPVEHLTAAG